MQSVHVTYAINGGLCSQTPHLISSSVSTISRNNLEANVYPKNRGVEIVKFSNCPGISKKPKCMLPNPVTGALKISLFYKGMPV